MKVHTTVDEQTVTEWPRADAWQTTAGWKLSE